MQILMLGAVQALLVGILMGLIGGGGAFVYTLLLVVVADVPVSTAIGTGLLVGALASIVAAYRHVREGNVDLRVALRCGITGGAVAVAASLLSGVVPDRPLRIALFAVLAVLGLLPLVRLARDRVRRRSPHPTPVDVPVLAGQRPVGDRFGAGAVTAVLGVGTGTFGLAGGTPLASYLSGRGVLAPSRAVGTSLVVVSFLSLVAAGAHAATGRIDWQWVALLTVGAAAGAWIGAGLTARVPQSILLAAVGGLSLLTSVGMLLSS